MAALVYVVAAVAMFFSALSYKEMAREYPDRRVGLLLRAASASTTSSGFLAGWAILLDYLLLPALLSVFAAAAMGTVLPGVPAWVWIVVFVVAGRRGQPAREST